MDKDSILNAIFENDPEGLLNVQPRTSYVRTPDERLAASFEEINAFVEKHGRPPQANVNDVGEFKLFSRLRSLTTDLEKIEMLTSSDRFHLLPEVNGGLLNEDPLGYQKSKVFNSVEDIFSDDALGLLGDDDETGLFEFKHTPKEDARASADFVARRKPCKNFDQYEQTFKQVQADLASGKRRLIPFRQENLQPGDFYVHRGVLLFLESVDFEDAVQEFNSGRRIRKDGRTRTIFENGTESQMLYRSLYKVILADGFAVSQNVDEVNEKFIRHFNEITVEDKEAGYIYVLKSRSTREELASIQNLYKIGYANTEVGDRIRNAENEPTYLMAPVEYIAGWKCYNLNPQKFEQLLHNFFGSSCLEVDVFDHDGRRHTPREWFIAPLAVIEQAIELIISGEIVQYSYDPKAMMISKR